MGDEFAVSVYGAADEAGVHVAEDTIFCAVFGDGPHGRYAGSVGLEVVGTAGFGGDVAQLSVSHSSLLRRAVVQVAWPVR